MKPRSHKKKRKEDPIRYLERKNFETQEDRPCLLHEVSEGIINLGLFDKN